LSTRGSGGLRQRGGAVVARGDLPQAKRRLAAVQGSDGSRLGPRGAVRGEAGVACWGREGAGGVGKCQAHGQEGRGPRNKMEGEK
jgi:hypothetical protein